MNHRTLSALGVLTLASLALAPQASARSGQDDSQSIRIEADTQDFSDDFGSLRSVKLEYKYDAGDTTVLFTPAVGQRRVAGMSDTAFGAGAAIYHDWSDRISTRTELFISRDAPVFAQYDLSQDITVKVARSTTVTLGGRWARYAGGRDVTFVSLGARRYFRGGSVAYRLTRVDPQGLDAFYAHLVNLSIDDGRGAGKTQLWLSTGASELARSQVAGNFTGRDYAAMLRRTQPLTSNLALIAGAGYTSYDRPGKRIGATDFTLGLQMGID